MTKPVSLKAYGLLIAVLTAAVCLSLSRPAWADEYRYCHYMEKMDEFSEKYHFDLWDYFDIAEKNLIVDDPTEVLAALDKEQKKIIDAKYTFDEKMKPLVDSELKAYHQLQLELFSNKIQFLEKIMDYYKTPNRKTAFASGDFLRIKNYYMNQENALQHDITQEYARINVAYPLSCGKDNTLPKYTALVPVIVGIIIYIAAYRK